MFKGYRIVVVTPAGRRRYMQLLVPHSAGGVLDRLSTELEMLLTGGADGGLFIVIGRRRS